MNKKLVALAVCAVVASAVTACSTDTRLDGTKYKPDYTTKPVYCWQLPPTEQQPNKNCIPTHGK